MKLVAITGGIGTGKSVVSRMLGVMGYPVYDCDSEAKRLMVSDEELVAGIKNLLGNDAYALDGSLNREYVASCIFSDKALVAQMNALVHPAVLRDITRWASNTGSESNFVETALLRESNMVVILDDVWEVTAPLELRIKRVARRSNLTEEQTRARISNQSFADDDASAHIIVNDGVTPLIPQVLALLNAL